MRGCSNEDQWRVLTLRYLKKKHRTLLEFPCYARVETRLQNFMQQARNTYLGTRVKWAKRQVLISREFQISPIHLPLGHLDPFTGDKPTPLPPAREKKRRLALAQDEREERREVGGRPLTREAEARQHPLALTSQATKQQICYAGLAQSNSNCLAKITSQISQFSCKIENSSRKEEVCATTLLFLIFRQLAPIVGFYIVT